MAQEGVHLQKWINITLLDQCNQAKFTWVPFIVNGKEIFIRIKSEEPYCLSQGLMSELKSVELEEKQLVSGVWG